MRAEVLAQEEIMALAAGQRGREGRREEGDGGRGGGWGGGREWGGSELEKQLWGLMVEGREKIWSWLSEMSWCSW